MKTRLPILVLALVAWTGCGKKDAPTTVQPELPDSHQHADAGHLATESAAPLAIPADAPPDRIVGYFLEALRTGDDTVAEGLLTVKARVETSKRELTVQPPGSPTAQFEIGGSEYLDAQHKAAHVKSVWTEDSPDGERASYEIVWALRRQDDGWRVAGMATQLVDDQPAVFLNFEDPDDMLAKWHEADQIAKERDAEQIRHAQNPSAPGRF